MMPNDVPRRLYRSRSERMLAGVAGGLAEYFGVDPTLVRLAFVLLALPGGAPGILPYLVLAIVVPEEPLGAAGPASPATSSLPATSPPASSVPASSLPAPAPAPAPSAPVDAAPASVPPAAVVPPPSAGSFAPMDEVDAAATRPDLPGAASAADGGEPADRTPLG
jgi:phage shock protein C